jgi:hypothetical protein
MLDGIEGRMIKAFGSAGRSIHAFEVERIRELITGAGPDGMLKSDVLRATWTDVSPANTDMILNYLCEMKVIRNISINGQVGFKFCSLNEQEE